jgi:hypothetical protein
MELVMVYKKITFRSTNYITLLILKCFNLIALVGFKRIKWAEQGVNITISNSVSGGGAFDFKIL